MQDFWKKQGNESLFPSLEWDKPERRDQAGRLLIVGGSVHALGAPSLSYDVVQKTGIGEARLALPDKTKILVGSTLPAAVFMPSTTSGEFAREESASVLLSYAQWANTLLFCGDSGRNSQTVLLFSDTLQSYNGQAIITRDAFDILSHTPDMLLQREKTTLVISFSQLQKLVKESREVQALAYHMELTQLIDFLHDFTLKYPAAIVTLFQKQLIIASHGNVSTTKVSSSENEETFAWRTRYAALAACYQTWNPFKPFEALTQAAAVF